MRVRKKNVIAVLTIVFLCVFLFPEEKEEDIAEVLYQEGLKKYILKDYLGAINDFQSAYDLKRDEEKIKNMYINALIKQGDIEYKQKDYEAAEKHFKQALKLSGDDKTLEAMLIKVNQAIEEERKLQELSAPTPAPTAVPTPARTAEGYELTERPEDGGKITGYSPPKEETTSMKTGPSVIRVEMPYDMDEFIRRQNEENMRMLDKLIDYQEKERELLLSNINLIAESQAEDRVLFGNLLYIILGIIGSILLVIVFILVMIVVRRRRQLAQEAVYPQPLLSHDTQEYIESTRDFDETKYITDEHYSGLVKAKRLSSLYLELKQGNLDWDSLQSYISELNYELKTEVLNLVEKIIKSGEIQGTENAMKILLPFITDSEENVRVRSKAILSGITRDSLYTPEDENVEACDSTDALSLSNLRNLAHMVDTKTGREDHSIHVAEIASRIAEEINQPDLDPLLVMKIGLAHDIGFLEIDDKILRKEGSIREKQFEIIKSHPEKGIRFFSYTDLPKIVKEGILYHHERLDGSGYPYGLKGDKIPPIARIIAVADIFDAATSPRPYKKSLSPELCLQMMETITGSMIDKEIYNVLSAIYEKEKGMSDAKE
jgi:putative nucleotidyltransferase with HDIG domain